MSNEKDGDSTHDPNPRMAALLAVHLVSQILDEAFVIANAAKDSGQPWHYLSMLKSFKTSRLNDTDDEDASFGASKGDCDLNENKIEIVANVATSTPQKITARVGCSDEGDISVHHNDITFIGQGDEDIESQQSELVKSTSMIINHLFDMSDVERIVICDDTEVLQSTSEPNELLAETMNKIMESYDANTEIPVETFPLVPNITIIDGQIPTEQSKSDNSDYSFLADAFVADISRDAAFYVDEIPCEKHEDDGSYQSAVVEELNEKHEDKTENVIEKNDQFAQNALYENAYATLNRDYDQASEDDGFPILQDPKGMNLQEVELMTANTSNEDLGSSEFLQQKPKPKEEVPTVSDGVNDSQKRTLARKCRLQGARLLACLRGWWRRKTPGKRKESRYPGTARGMCPLSPEARRRGSSLVDNRQLRSSSPSCPVSWKFNTVNEVLVNSNHWKEYTFDTKPENFDED